jgi:hypothetical protein
MDEVVTSLCATTIAIAIQKRIVARFIDCIVCPLGINPNVLTAAQKLAHALYIRHALDPHRPHSIGQ